MRRLALTLGVAAAVASLAWIMMTGLGHILRAPAPDPTVDDAPALLPSAAPATPATPRIKATIYFASEDGQRLVPTEREVPLATDAAAQARAILEAQFAAEAPTALVPAIPAGTTLRALFVSAQHDVFVDLGPSVRATHPGGSTQELLTVYAIVNAVLTNLPTLQQVQILIDGQEVDTLAGHLDLRRPLRKNDALIAGSR